MLFVLLLSCLVQSVPVSPEFPSMTRRGQQLPFYYPAVTYSSFSPIPLSGLAKRSDQDDLSFGHSQLLIRLKVRDEELKIRDTNRDSAGVLHIYAVGVKNKIVVDNHNAAIHIQHGQVLSFSSSFSGASLNKRSIEPESVSPISLDSAVKIAQDHFKIGRDGFPSKQVYVQVPSGDIRLSYQFQLRDDDKSKWYQVSVDASTGSIVQAIDYYNEYSIKALVLPKLAPADGFDTISDPSSNIASPKGWHNDGAKAYTDTQGNNVMSRIAGARGKPDITVDGGSALQFDHLWSAADAPDSAENRKASIINNFYISNMMHDVSYQYGFDEASGNFQRSNFGKGGRGNDRVDVKNQANGVDNANFATPPDGQAGVMQMYLWDRSTPGRDGSLNNDVPMHEYTHGISNRLTGGSAQGNCLGDNTSGGMGEGWSDTLAYILLRKDGETRDLDIVIGAYVFNNPAGIRSKPYSTSLVTNPYTLSFVATQNEVHRIGEYWATTLYEVYWNMVDAHGFSANLFDSKQLKGNVMTLQLIIGGFKLQPCNPTFTSARDAILSADQAYYSGANKCLIWTAFAKRGLGVDAVEEGFVDGFALPAECNTK